MRLFQVVLCLAGCTLVLSAPSGVSFVAHSSVQRSVSRFVAHANAAIQKRDRKIIAGSFPPKEGSKQKVDIFDDIPGVFYFKADMDIDCDGKDFKGNPDGLPNTSFGTLDATQVPWIVIPESFFEKKNVPQNALSAVLCDGRLFYGIMGDTNGDKPEVIGEASLLLGNACFPYEQLNGGTGHDALDVLYIVLMTEFEAVNDTSITDFNALCRLGDQKMTSLLKGFGGARSGKDQFGVDTQEYIM